MPKRNEDTGSVPSQAQLARFIWEPGDIEIIKKPKPKKSLEASVLETLKKDLNT